jgi:hypothetical protein
MINKTAISTFILLLLVGSLFAQKYSRNVTYRKPTLTEFIYWRSIYTENIDNKGKVHTSLIEKLLGFNSYQDDFVLKDSIKMQFKVLGIERINNFYSLSNNKITKAKVYTIYLSPIVDGEVLKRKFDYFGKEFIENVSYRILTVCKETKRKQEIIKEGDIYNFYLYTFFDKALPILYSGSVCPVFIDGTCNLSYPIGEIEDFYITPNLKGLYYEESE